jgi:ribosome biogenesis GTP-binding protein ylqF
MTLDSMHGVGIKELLNLMSKIEDDINKDRVRKKNLRLMIVGVPNVGKSSLINRLTGKKSAKTGDKPGVTKGKQWLTLSNGMQLLDTPGILWPKFEDENVGIKLAFCGSIKDEILDLETLALRLIELLQEEYPKLLANRYKLEEISDEGLVNMDNIALNRGFILSKGRIDYSRCAKTVLDEFRSAQIGRITLERAK